MSDKSQHRSILIAVAAFATVVLLVGIIGYFTIGNEKEIITICGEYTSFNTIQKYIEDNGFELVSGGFERIPNVDLKEVTEEQRATLEKLTGLLEDDEDVTNVYTTLKPADE